MKFIFRPKSGLIFGGLNKFFKHSHRKSGSLSKLGWGIRSGLGIRYGLGIRWGIKLVIRLVQG